MESVLTFLSVVGTLGILSALAKWITNVASPHVDAALEKRRIEKKLRDAEKAAAEEAEAERQRIEKERVLQGVKKPVDLANEIIGSKD